jgi:DNA-binding IclR family transcriptional regulator
MRGLSSLERVILEVIGKQSFSYEEVQMQSGLQENVCFNILQALIIRGILRTDSGRYKVSEHISPLMMEEINGLEARKAESLELMEAILEQKTERVFRFQKVAMDSRDEKIFLAMLSNLESFLKDAHMKAQSSVPHKERKVVFWGMGEVQVLMNQVMVGR